MTNQFNSAQVESSSVGEAAQLGAAVGSKAAESAANMFRDLLQADDCAKDTDNICSDLDKSATRDEVNKAEALPNLEIEKGMKERPGDFDDQAEQNHEGEGTSKLKEFGKEMAKELPNAIWNAVNKDKYEVSDKDRNKAKDVLSDQISDLIPPKDQKALRTMQTALIDGDMEAFSKAIKEAATSPEKLKMFVKELNDQLNEKEVRGGIDIHTNGEDVYLYRENGNTALKIDTESGEASIHPIEHRKDGSVVMAPGEIINKEPEDVMQSISDEATRSITRKVFNFEPSFKPGRPRKPIIDGKIEPYFQKPGGPADQGKGFDPNKFEFLNQGARAAMKAIED